MIELLFRRDMLFRPLCAGAAIGVMLAAGMARADSGDTLNFLVGTTIRNEDNLFRLASSVDPLVAVGKETRADQVRVGYAGIQLDKAYSQQQLHLDVTATTYRYRTFGRLNFDAFDYAGSWKWHLTQRLSGTLSMDHKQTQANFSDSTNYGGNNTNTSENRRADVDWWLHGSWHLTAGATQTSSTNSQLNTAQDSFRQRGGDAGVRYVAESGSTITLLARQARGEYAGRTLNAVTLTDTGFDQTDAEAQVNWLASGESTVNGRLTRLDRRHHNFARRDYQGTAGRLDYTWTPTGKLQFKLSAARDIASYQEATNSYYVNDGLTLAPIWKISEKTALRASLGRSQRDYLGGATAPPAVARQDQIRSAQLNFDWAPMRALSLSASLQRDSRSSGNQNLGFVANAAGVTAQLSF
jgi:exopolysaccharide biosynthesis operon protein EpsL